MKRKVILAFFFLCSLSHFAAAEEVQYLTTEEFKKVVFDYTTNNQWHYQGTIPCIIDFYTTWCGPCKRLAPVMEELAEKYCEQIRIYKVDTERERELAALFGIRSIPTLLFCPLNDKPQMAQGALPKDVLEKAIQEVLLHKTK